MDEDEVPEDEYEAFAEAEEDELEEQQAVLDPNPRQIPHDRLGMTHRTLEEIFCAAGKMVGSPQDPVLPGDLVIVADGGSRPLSFVEWANV